MGVDAEISALAKSQQGQVARWQLRDLGVDRFAIARRVNRGVLFPFFPGVFSVGHPPTTVLAWAWAAVLACGPDAVLSYESAAALWEMGPQLKRPFHVTARSNRHIEGIIVHRGKLTRNEITRQQGIPVTTPARTALDVASTSTPAQLARAVNEARIAGYLHEATLDALVARSEGHRGVKALRPLAFQAQSQAPTRSEFERVFLALTKRYGLPMPLVNVGVAGHLVDAYFPNHKLIVELDSWQFHRDRASFETDRNRDTDHLALGLATVRITWERLTGHPDREARRLAAILRRRRSIA